MVGHGYNALVADIFGKKFRGAERDVMFGEMNRLGGDRAALRDRLLSILELARAQSEMDSGRIATIGFCFGGKCALDLARSGADIAGIASFHGLFDPSGLPPERSRPRSWPITLGRPDGAQQAVLALARD